MSAKKRSTVSIECDVKRRSQEKRDAKNAKDIDVERKKHQLKAAEKTWV